MARASDSSAELVRVLARVDDIETLLVRARSGALLEIVRGVRGADGTRVIDGERAHAVLTTLSSLRGAAKIVGVERGKRVVVTQEHVAGSSLDDLEREGAPALTATAAAVFFEPIADALAALHKTGHAHGALTGHSVRVDVEGNAKLVDIPLRLLAALAKGDTGIGLDPRAADVLALGELMLTSLGADVAALSPTIRPLVEAMRAPAPPARPRASDVANALKDIQLGNARVKARPRSGVVRLDDADVSSVEEARARSDEEQRNDPPTMIARGRRRLGASPRGASGDDELAAARDTGSEKETLDLFDDAPTSLDEPNPALAAAVADVRAAAATEGAPERADPRLTGKLAAGTKLGRYTVLQEIGQGGLAEVYLANIDGAHGFQKRVALKRIKPHLLEDQSVVRALIDEARITVLLNHPNVASVLELVDDDDEMFLVMEYIHGPSLAVLLRDLDQKRQRMPLHVAGFIVAEMLLGLHGAHEQRLPSGKSAGIIHRDVSPQNVIVSTDGHVKVIDFGIAKAEGRLNETAAGIVKGKIRYFAPELIDRARFAGGNAPDRRVDVWAAGVVLHELVAWKRLFATSDQRALLPAITDLALPDLHVSGACDAELWAVIARALARHRDDRYPTAEAMAADLRRWLFARDPSFTSARVKDVVLACYAK